MRPRKLTIEYESESDVCECEIMTITANPSLCLLFDENNGEPEYYITITSETGISFNDKAELNQVIDNFINVVEQLKLKKASSLI